MNTNPRAYFDSSLSTEQEEFVRLFQDFDTCLSEIKANKVNADLGCNGSTKNRGRHRGTTDVSGRMSGGLFAEILHYSMGQSYSVIYKTLGVSPALGLRNRRFFEQQLKERNMLSAFKPMLPFNNTSSFEDLKKKKRSKKADDSILARLEALEKLVQTLLGQQRLTPP